MEISPQEFGSKSVLERIAFLGKSGGFWAILISIGAFSASVASISAEYISRIQLQQEAKAQEETRVFVMRQLAEQSQLLQVTVDDLANSVSQVSDAQLRQNLLEKVLRVQKQTSAIVTTVYQNAGKLRYSQRMSSVGLMELASRPVSALVSVALADQPPATQPAAIAPPSNPRFTQEDARLYVMLSVFIVLGVTFIVSVIAIFKATNPDVLKFAFDTVKTLMGFFIGVATAFLGLPAAPH